MGGGEWKERKEKIKKRIMEIEGNMIKIEEERKMRGENVMKKKEGIYEEFEERFKYDENEEKLKEIEEVEDDIEKGKKMDRII